MGQQARSSEGSRAETRAPIIGSQAQTRAPTAGANAEARASTVGSTVGANAETRASTVGANAETRPSTDAFSGTVLLAAQAPGAGLPEDPLIGCELAGAYRVAQVLGEGAMGRLYEAEHLRLDRRFAIKVLHQPLAQRDDMRARFDREARVMSRIKSDHVVDVIDVTAAPDGRMCLVTELLEGVDLERLLETRGGRLPVAEAVSLTRQCLRGLSAAHALGIVHRDLKPSNLFLAREASGRATLKVLDFGVAKNSGEADLTAAGTIMGTPAYMAPEQARGARFADARSDLYAVGAVLYRLLTGRAPYDEEDVHGTLIRLMQEAPVRPSALERSIPAGLEAIMERAMARDPAERFQSAAELDAALAVFDSAQQEALTDVSGPSGAESAQAATLSRRARLVRPLAVATTGLLALAAGTLTSALLALFVNAFEPRAPLGKSSLWLVLIGGGASFILVLTFAQRALADAWRNAPAVQALTRRFARTLLGLSAALGAQELAATVAATCLLRRPAETDPVYACLRMAIAAALAAAFALGRRPGRR